MKTAFLIFLITFCFIQNGITQQQLKVYKFDAFEENILKRNDSDTLLVINFWATWCGPCVNELPYFEKINSEYSHLPIKVILVSLDFEKQYQSRLLPFINEKELKSEIIWLNDTKYNDWIDRVSPDWSGAIPATVFVKRGKVIKFIEKELEMEELTQTINNLL